jgi:hypothetical protein
LSKNQENFPVFFPLTGKITETGQRQIVSTANKATAPIWGLLLYQGCGGFDENSWVRPIHRE